MRSPIIQELRGWLGQNHELHRLQRTTIKREEAALSKTTLNLQPKQKPQVKKVKKNKRSIVCHTRNVLCQTPMKIVKSS